MFGESLALKRRANRTALGVRPDTMRVVVYTREVLSLAAPIW
jgi:hypothetical protein